MNVRLVFLPIVAAAVALYWWQATPADRPLEIPAATWRVGLGTDTKPGENYGELPAESPIRVSYTCALPRHVYVFSHSREDGTVLLFPAAELRSDLSNPVPGGHQVLPGKHDGKELAWTTRSEILATTTYVIVAAAEPVPELEALLPRLRRWTSSVLTSAAMLVTLPGNLEPSDLAGAPRQGWPVPLLQTAADRFVTATVVNGPLEPVAERPGVWASAWRVKETPGTGKAREGGLPALPDALKPLVAPAAPAPEKR